MKTGTPQQVYFFMLFHGVADQDLHDPELCFL
jgi:hypothetical protein